MRLTDFSSNQWSQFGEDGIIAEIFRRVGEESRFCVEFGAADGVTCSNTKALREQGWEALLIESDKDRYGKIQESEIIAGVNSMNVEVTSENINHIVGRYPIDFISIDVDGDDYAIWEAMRISVRVVCIEYNASIPPHVSLRQARKGGQLGSSALALCQLAEVKGYVLVSLTKGNLIFVLKDYEDKFNDLECGLTELYDYNWLCYFSTDYLGRPFVTGAEPPWGVANSPFVAETVGDVVEFSSHDPVVLRASFEALYGPASFVPWDSEIGSHLSVQVGDVPRRRMLEGILRERGLVIVDISQHAVTAKFEWIFEVAHKSDYQVRIIPSSIIAFIPNF